MFNNIDELAKEINEWVEMGKKINRFDGIKRYLTNLYSGNAHWTLPHLLHTVRQLV